MMQKDLDTFNKKTDLNESRIVELEQARDAIFEDLADKPWQDLTKALSDSNTKLYEALRDRVAMCAVRRKIYEASLAEAEAAVVAAEKAHSKQMTATRAELIKAGVGVDSDPLATQNMPAAERRFEYQVSHNSKVQATTAALHNARGQAEACQRQIELSDTLRAEALVELVSFAKGSVR